MASPSPPAPSAAPLPPPREPGAPYRVCLVCLGNICRSPMAETVLRASLVQAGLDGAVSLDSAGTGDWPMGQPMYPLARVALASRGYGGSAHRARQFRPSWFARRDLVLAMDRYNLATLQRMARPADSDRIRLFGEVGGLAGTDGGEIPDPIGENASMFGYVLDLIATAAPVIVARLARLLRPAMPGDSGRRARGAGPSSRLWARSSVVDRGLAVERGHHDAPDRPRSPESPR